MIFSDFPLSRALNSRAIAVELGMGDSRKLLIVFSIDRFLKTIDTIDSIIDGRYEPFRSHYKPFRNVGNRSGAIINRSGAEKKTIDNTDQPSIVF